MNFKHHRLPLESIDFEDQTFCLSYPCRAQNLLGSIDLIGIIHPPIVRKKGGRFQIICGRGRLIAAQKLGLTEVTCQVLPPWIDDLTCLTIAFEENLTSRGFNIIEQALVVKKFLHYLSEEEVIKNILPCLGYRPAYKNFQFLVSLNLLENEVKEFLLKEVLSPQLAVKFLELDEEDRRELVKIFACLRPGTNRQRQIFEFLTDWARREEKTIKEILNLPDIRQILENERLNPPQKTEKFYAYLRKQLMPRLSAREEAFREWASRLAGKGVRLLPPPAFESDSYILQVQFKDLADLARKWQELAEKLKKTKIN